MLYSSFDFECPVIPRSGTDTDPYKFNAAKVRASIKRELLIAPKAASSQLAQGETDIYRRADKYL